MMNNTLLAIALTLTIIISTSISAEERPQFMTSLNGVKVELKGTLSEHNNIVIQSDLPIFEFELNLAKK